MRIDAMDAFYLSQLAIASSLKIENKADEYLERLKFTNVGGVALKIRNLDTSDPIAKSYLRWAQGL
jgi:hypothetical protein